MTNSSRMTIIVAGLAAFAAALLTAAAMLIIASDDNAPIQLMIPTPESSPGVGGVANPLTEAGSEADIKVYITGAVNQPGVYTLKEGDRLEDAVKAAGGKTSEADLESINLARRIRDGEQYRIPRVGEAVASLDGLVSGPASAGNEAASNGLINLNAATLEQLESLPGIGEVKAQSIIDYRNQNGPFGSVEEIVNVSGIGPATLENIRNLVTIGGGY